MWKFFLFKQKTAYEMRISDWSSDVCSSDLLAAGEELPGPRHALADAGEFRQHGIGLGTAVGQIGAALLGDAVELLGALGDDRGEADLFQIGQRRIDYAGARCVETVAVLVERLDDLVAMTRLLDRKSTRLNSSH